jgi:hypothetical protein
VSITTHADVLREISRLCDDALMLAGNTPQAEVIRSTRERLHGPLRVAIAGRVKAGKSTLLNALVGERLAPTDAGECTRIVSWYQQGFSYDVQAVLRDGSNRPLRFSREDGALEIDLGLYSADEVERLEVNWPTSNLSRMTLIDTPGLASLDDSTSARTRDFLALEDDDRRSDADAVIYLMRHLHRHDSEFLDAFMDRSVSNASPVNAVGILSRADEIGAGRLDALDSARAIANRYSNDDRVRSLCVTVLPVAGLLAETGMTLQEHEAAALREIAGLDESELALMLLSVDRFCAPDASHVLVETRRLLLERLGLFGIRYSIAAMREGRARSAPELARLLVDTSGLDALRSVLDGHFTARAQMLKARSALSSLRTSVRELAELDPPGTRRLMLDIERFEASTHAFAELRLVHMVLSGILKVSPDHQAEITRLTGDGPAASRVGCPPDASADDIRIAALNGIERWRTLAGSPLIDRESADAFNIAVRSYEGIYANPA